MFNLIYFYFTFILGTKVAEGEHHEEILQARFKPVHYVKASVCKLLL